MPKLLLPFEGETGMLTRGIKTNNMTLRLFTTDMVASEAVMAAYDSTDFTEATFTGYAAITLTAASWAITTGQPTIATQTQQTFTRTATGAAESIYGYYLLDVTTGDVMWWEQFGAPFSITTNLDTVKISPLITLGEVSDVPIGMMMPFTGAAADVPEGYSTADGTTLSRTTYTEYFALVGTTYGVGDGSTTFNKPDMRQKFPLGQAASGTGSTLGATGGAIDHVHDLSTGVAEITMDVGTTDIMISRVAATSWTENLSYSATAGSSASTSSSNTTGADLQGDTVAENPPFLATPYMIKVL